MYIMRVRKSALSEWKGTRMTWKGGDGMQQAVGGTYLPRHTKASVYHDAARMAAEVLFSNQTHACLLHIDIQTYAKSHCS